MMEIIARACSSVQHLRLLGGRLPARGRGRRAGGDRSPGLVRSALEFSAHELMPGRNPEHPRIASGIPAILGPDSSTPISVIEALFASPLRPVGQPGQGEGQ